MVPTIASRQSLVEDRPVHDPEAFSFLAPIEANWMRVHAELETLLRSRAKLPAFHEPDQRYISKGDDWKVFTLFGFGVPIGRPMRPFGRTVNKLLMWGIKRSAYFKDAERNRRPDFGQVARRRSGLAPKFASGHSGVRWRTSDLLGEPETHSR
ncbi:MAG TPA: hypothetical protein VFZ03_16415 [Dongiaceae bacterium]